MQLVANNLRKKCMLLYRVARRGGGRLVNQSTVSQLLTPFKVWGVRQGWPRFKIVRRAPPVCKSSPQ